MHPLVGFAEELRRLRELTERVAAEEPEVEYLCGTMIELPRACVRADEIAEYADFCSFGTNDLTQTALGFSRDDAEGKFLTYYLEHGVLERNPFEVLDREGVGDLMRIAVERGRGVKPELKIGICGEHGGEPRSVAFCHELGLDYVSLLAVPRAARASRRGAGRARRRRRHVGRRRRLLGQTAGVQRSQAERLDGRRRCRSWRSRSRSACRDGRLRQLGARRPRSVDPVAVRSSRVRDLLMKLAPALLVACRGRPASRSTPPYADE